MEGEGKGIGRDEKGKVRREEGKGRGQSPQIFWPRTAPECAVSEMCVRTARQGDRQTDRHATVPLNRC